VINSNGGSQQVIAITGIVSTAAVALMGLGVQLWLSRQQRKRDRREARYRELSGTYERVGRLGRLWSRLSDAQHSKGSLIVMIWM
jgi:hypothetical protein